MEWSTADFRRESGHSAPQNFSAKKVDFPRARAYPIAIAIAEGVVAGCVRAQDLEPPGDSYADGLHSIRYWNGEFPFEEGIRRRRPSSLRVLMPMSAGDAPALAAGRPFSARIAPIYEGGAVVLAAAYGDGPSADGAGNFPESAAGRGPSASVRPHMEGSHARMRQNMLHSGRV